MEFVAAAGVKHLFMLTGGGCMHLVDSVGRTPGIEYICPLHEQACAYAAEAYAEVTNGLGAVLVTTGPGGTNAITGVAAAWLESASVLVISGQAKRADLIGDTGVRSMGQQEVAIVSGGYPHHQVRGNRAGAGIHPLSPGKGGVSGDARPSRPGVDRYPPGRAGNRNR